MNISDRQTFKALPVQMIETDNAVILKRGCTEFRIMGEGSAQAIHQILGMAGTLPSTSQEICEKFSQPQRPIIKNLIEQLLRRRILVATDDRTEITPTVESHLDIFYWHFGESEASVSKKLTDLRIVVLGVNYISRQLLSSLHNSGMANVQVVDFPLLRNLRLFDEQGQLEFRNWNVNNSSPLDYSKWVDNLDQDNHSCIVATSDFGNHEVLRYWNKFCLLSNCHFLPVVLQNIIGYVGPLTVPKETACLECLRARQDANFKDPSLQRATEAKAFEGQAVIGFHPSMASVLGDIAAIELIKFYTGILPEKNVGSLIEINLLATFMAVRKILKNPRCHACSPLMIRSPLQTRKNNPQVMDEKI